jgi:CheY-like chemotaxis protein
MRTAAERGAKLTAQLLAFSRRQKLNPKPVDLNEMVAGMRDLLQSTLGGSVEIKTLLKQELWLAFVDPTQIELAILNLAINARDAMEVGGTLTIETGNVSLGPPERPEEPVAGEYAMIAVTDDGTGMTPEVLAKAFEPFFTTKGVGRGTGLGLSQVLGFVKQTGGGVRVQTRVGEGTTFRIYLPRAAWQTRSEAGEGPRRSRASLPLRASVMVVDDDNAVREVIASTLREMGHVVFEVGSGGAALDLLEQRPKLDFAIVDFAMPGMNGRELARQMQAKDPTLPVLFVTGYADLSALGDVGEELVIRKPFLGDELSGKLTQALSRIKRVADGKIIPIRR